MRVWQFEKLSFKDNIWRQPKRKRDKHANVPWTQLVKLWYFHTKNKIHCFKYLALSCNSSKVIFRQSRLFLHQRLIDLLNIQKMFISYYQKIVSKKRAIGIPIGRIASPENVLHTYYIQHARFISIRNYVVWSHYKIFSLWNLTRDSCTLYRRPLKLQLPPVRV